MKKRHHKSRHCALLVRLPLAQAGPLDTWQALRQAYTQGALGVDPVDNDDALDIASRIGASTKLCIAEDPATNFVDLQRLSNVIAWLTAAGPGALPEQGWHVMQLIIWHAETNSDVMCYLFYRGSGALPLVQCPASTESAGQEADGKHVCCTIALTF
jgi:hypothetical protein